jgi:hypothetical protein
MVRFLHPPKEKQMDVKITQLSSNHNRVRTKRIVGKASILPREGKHFTMFAEPLDKSQDVRMLSTSRIKSVRREKDVIYFETENSKYKLEIINGAESQASGDSSL